MDERTRYRYTERCMYDWLQNKARIEILSFDLRTLRQYGDVRAQGYLELTRRNGTHSDPVAEYGHECQRLEAELLRLSRITEPISRMLDDFAVGLEVEYSKCVVYKAVFEGVYSGRGTLRAVADELGISVKTCRKRRVELVRICGEYLGF